MLPGPTMAASVFIVFAAWRPPVFRRGNKRRSSSRRVTFTDPGFSRISFLVVRMAYKCRAYPDQEQASVLNRTFGCVRVVWNQTLAWRHQRYQAGKTGTTFAQANAYLTAMKATDELAWLNEVSSVPLQQAIRHQQAAYAAFFAQRARYPRFKSRNGRQSAEYTRSAFRWRNGALYLAKMGTPLAFTWSWPGTDPATIDPTTVTVSRDPCGRWYVSLAVDTAGPERLPATGRAVGVDLGINGPGRRTRPRRPCSRPRRARCAAAWPAGRCRCCPGRRWRPVFSSQADVARADDGGQCFHLSSRGVSWRWPRPRRARRTWPTPRWGAPQGRTRPGRRTRSRRWR